MRTNLRDSVSTDMIAPTTKARIIARNTFQFTAPNGDKVTRLHQTDIIRVTPKGKTVLNSGGWKTKTTKERIDGLLPAGYRLTANKGSWYIVQNNTGRPWDSANPRIPYYDGITLPDCFNGAAARKAKAAETREQKLRLQIRNFVNKLDKLECLPNPSPGDCWICSMFQREPENGNLHKGFASMSKTGPTENNGHIQSHVKEGYLHGSLILNALKWAGYPNPQLIGAMDNADMKRGKKPSMTKRALKRYLYRKLGLAA